MLFSTFYALSQNNTEWKTQGNAADTSAFIGTTNSSSLILRSNNTERMRIHENGNIGIGVDNPERSLDVDGDIQLPGDIIFKGYEDFQDSLNRFLIIDRYGKTQPKSINSLRNYMYEVDCYLTDEDDPVVMRGAVGLKLPSWANDTTDNKQILFTGVGCPTWVGIGTDLPMSTLDVRGDGSFYSGVKIGDGSPTVNTGLFIENHGSSSHPAFNKLILVKNTTGRKVLQLEDNGLLRAREIKIDEESWADYVFQKDYPLMSLNKLKTFIEENGHLPNVPSAAEIKAEGLSLGEAAKTSMEKIEELTLYLIDVNERLEKQEMVLEEQQQLLKQQRETIHLQQELIEELKQLTNKK